MDLELKRIFKNETNKDVFDWSKDNEVVYTQDYVDWLEMQVKNCHIANVSKRIFVVEILEKEKGWKAISVDLDSYDEAESFFNEHRTDYCHREIRIVQVYVC